MLARVRLLACIGWSRHPEGVRCQNPAQSLTCCFSPPFVLARLIYPFMVQGFSWLALLVRSDAAARSIDVAAETAVAEPEGASLEQAAAQHGP